MAVFIPPGWTQVTLTGCLAGGDDVRQEGLGAVDDAPEVDVHHPVDVFELHVFDLAVVRDTGVVEDGVDLGEVGRDGIGVGEHRLALGDVQQL